ncbi:IS66 family insertion sequence element accessory protein TnpB [Lactobacillus ultunensis]|uniref:IS66 family element, Orf2 protein n=1 Tax=Lactobacillus ultunensis DSM 16047 TaxID=525365 RepID=C2EPM0_9LACO|nr:IS66 family insertion sequence element accessory protein TnpB [Lactobacillus ultunensis]EEJ71596.1 IS66 family element, Orf2 protein [Lactobacillus ultunensis DSM 16047]KRL82355.1 transposase ORF A [Lactobacillus ultunensis DSM 16047]
MINLSDLGRVYIVCGKTDLRKGIDGLATLVKEQFELDPFSGRVFLFCGGRKDRFKALYWDGQGYWLLYKRFENGTMNWPQNQNEVQALTSQQVDWLMKGFAITPHESAQFLLMLDIVRFFSIILTNKFGRKQNHVRRNFRKDYCSTSSHHSKPN